MNAGLTKHRLQLAFDRNIDVTVDATRRDDTPNGLFVHRSHLPERTDWVISHLSGWMVTDSFKTQKDALNCAARMTGCDWTQLDALTVQKTKIVPDPWQRVYKLAIMKFPRTAATNKGYRWRVAL